jgi:hypothetical protein
MTLKRTDFHGFIFDFFNGCDIYLCKSARIRVIPVWLAQPDRSVQLILSRMEILEP